MRLVVQGSMLPATTPEAIEKLNRLQEMLIETAQDEIRTEHVLHGGMYARTIRVEAGHYIGGALIRVPTMLIVNGDCAMLAGDGWAELTGYNVIAGSKGRKQFFVMRQPTELTMIFRTDAKTIEEAEAEFTEEADLLMSRRQQDSNDVFVITGE